MVVMLDNGSIEFSNNAVHKKVDALKKTVIAVIVTVTSVSM